MLVFFNRSASISVRFRRFGAIRNTPRQLPRDEALRASRPPFPLTHSMTAMNRAFLLLLLCMLPCTNRAQDADSVTLAFSKNDVRDVLRLYERLTGRPVFVALDMRAVVTVTSPGPASRAAAIEMIESSLRERYGIELRNNNHGQTLVTWSQDPAYPRRTESAPAPVAAPSKFRRYPRLLTPGLSADGR